MFLRLCVMAIATLLCGAAPIRGVSGDLPVRFAEEGAVPGDRIVGIVQPGSGITIYPIRVH